MFYFPYILSSHTKLFVLFLHLWDSSFLSRPLSSPNSVSMPTTLILRFKITHSFSLVLSLTLFLSIYLFLPLFQVLLFLAASQTSSRPRGLFPKRSAGWTPGNIRVQTRAWTRTLAHTRKRCALALSSAIPAAVSYLCLHLHIDFHNIVALYLTELQ